MGTVLEFLQVDVGLPRSPKVTRLARLLSTPERRISRQEAAGILVDLWSFAAIHYSDGILVDVEDPDLEAELEWVGKPGELVAALRLEGFLHKGGRLAGWDERYGAYLEKRRRDRERKQRERAEAKKLRGAESLGDGGCPEDVRRTSSGRPRAEHNIQENIKNNNMQTATPILRPPLVAPAGPVVSFLASIGVSKPAAAKIERAMLAETTPAMSIAIIRELFDRAKGKSTTNPAGYLATSLKAGAWRELLGEDSRAASAEIAAGVGERVPKPRIMTDEATARAASEQVRRLRESEGGAP